MLIIGVAPVERCHMHKLTLLTAAAFLTATPLALAHDAAGHPFHGTTRADYGGQFRYQHRDWSTPTKHKPGICWEWDILEGWQWTCNE
jgi:hypothetical protein